MLQKFSLNVCDLDSSIHECIEEHPETQSVFEKFGLDCSCGGKSLGYQCDQRELDRRFVWEAARRATKPQLLLKTDRFRLVRFIMASGDELAEHTAPGDITVQCLEGKMTFTAQGQTHHLIAGGLLYLTARVPHAVLSTDNATFLLTIQAAS